MALPIQGKIALVIPHQHNSGFGAAVEMVLQSTLLAFSHCIAQPLKQAIVDPYINYITSIFVTRGGELQTSLISKWSLKLGNKIGLKSLLQILLLIYFFIFSKCHNALLRRKCAKKAGECHIQEWEHQALPLIQRTKMNRLSQ